MTDHETELRSMPERPRVSFAVDMPRPSMAEHITIMASPSVIASRMQDEQYSDSAALMQPPATTADPEPPRLSIQLPRPSMAREVHVNITTTPASHVSIIQTLGKFKVAIILIFFGVAMAALIAMIGVLLALNKGDPDPTTLASTLTITNLMTHLNALERVASLHNNSRSVVAGYNASADYVTAQLLDARLVVATVPFTLPWAQELAPARMAMIAPTPTTYALTADFLTLSYSGSGTATGTLQKVSQLGCGAENFASFVAGNVALIMRGNCTFEQKASNAVNAGAIAALMFNDGDGAGRTAAFSGTLGSIQPIPVLGLSFALGSQLAAMPAGSVVMSASVSMEYSTAYTYNLVTDIVAQRADRVIVVGAHLDSVPAGPGINDNGSGTSVILEIARQFATKLQKPVNTVRFAWWGAEEEGLVGSTKYVQQLSPAERSVIVANLNFDMLGSPNFIRGVYEGSGAPEGPRAGSVYLTNYFGKCFTGRGLNWTMVEFNGRSDYAAFTNDLGVPAGGVETGAEVAKNTTYRAMFGGLANTPFDPCYHQSCDTVANIDKTALLQMAWCAASVIERLAYDTNIDQNLGIAASTTTTTTTAAKSYIPVRAATAVRDAHGHGKLMFD
eukprot:TRINITY_DN3089_c0_g1_i1.p1 TRINITY_DN3089_c0_g1~~TRINITY_DN3089_c0_g1_i1.p1  ORF type:complete len:618 (-),score=178.12 TRINITY_DN3089_c0_g1_i1:1466-3319(-)